LQPLVPQDPWQWQLSAFAPLCLLQESLQGLPPQAVKKNAIGTISAITKIIKNFFMF